MARIPALHLLHTWGLAALLLAQPQAASGQAAQGPSALVANTALMAAGANPAASDACLAPLKASPPRITGVEAVASDGTRLPPTGALGLRDVLQIRLVGGDALVTCLRSNRLDAVLFLDHVALPELKPRELRVDADGSVSLSYRLDRATAGTAGWNELLLRSWQDRAAGRAVEIGIGLSPLHEVARATLPNPLALGVGDPRTGAAVLLVCLFGLFFVWIGTDLLRDRGMATSQVPLAERTRSLARTLMLCWLLTTAAAVGIVCLNAGSVPPLDGGMPLLLAASGITLGSGALIDFFRKTVFSNSEGPAKDLMNDGEGLALHRVQALAVNGLLLALVWIELVQRASIANLDPRWSALMGISAGVYLYGKATERQPA